MAYLEKKCTNIDRVFIYDEEDASLVDKYNWWGNKNGVYANVNGRTVSLAKYLLDIDEKHSKVLRRNGDSFDYRRENLYSGNIYRKMDGYYEVECFDGRVFLISEESKPLVDSIKWHVDKNRYAITKLSSGRIIKLHRLLLDIVDRPEYEVDHINRDTLDNRLENLRLADRSLNCFNRDVSKYNKSGAVGVYKMNGYDDKWCVQINSGGVRYYLGSYDSFEEAKEVRVQAEKRYYA